MGLLGILVSELTYTMMHGTETENKDAPSLRSSSARAANEWADWTSDSVPLSPMLCGMQSQASKGPRRAQTDCRPPQPSKIRPQGCGTAHTRLPRKL